MSAHLSFSYFIKSRRCHQSFMEEILAYQQFSWQHFFFLSWVLSTVGKDSRTQDCLLDSLIPFKNPYLWSSSILGGLLLLFYKSFYWLFLSFWTNYNWGDSFFYNNYKLVTAPNSVYGKEETTHKSISPVIYNLWFIMVIRLLHPPMLIECPQGTTISFIRTENHSSHNYGFLCSPS